jgi:hypothetical protein
MSLAITNRRVDSARILTFHRHQNKWHQHDSYQSFTLLVRFFHVYKFETLDTTFSKQNFRNEHLHNSASILQILHMMIPRKDSNDNENQDNSRTQLPYPYVLVSESLEELLQHGLEREQQTLLAQQMRTNSPTIKTNTVNIPPPPPTPYTATPIEVSNTHTFVVIDETNETKSQSHSEKTLVFRKSQTNKSGLESKFTFK